MAKIRRLTRYMPGATLTAHLRPGHSEVLMKAAVLRAAREPLEIEDVRIDAPRPREVLVRTGACGVCHSDLHYVDGKRGIEMPAVLGHEGSGTVEAVGDLVSYVGPGDRVITCLSTFCGHCEKCLSGRPSLCDGDDVERASAEPPRLTRGGAPITQLLNIGGFAEQMLVHENSVVKVDDGLPFEQLALVSCGVTTGIGAVLNTAKVEAGTTVAVIGCGGVGLNCVQGAVIAGARRIVAVDTIEAKLEMARNFGATDVINASTSDVVSSVKDLTDGGVDYSFEAIGNKWTTAQAFKMLKSGGTATVIGLFPDGETVELEGELFIGERRIQGSSMGSNRFRIDIPRYLDLYKQGRLKLDELVSKRLELDRINDAFEEMKQGRVARSVIVF